MARPRRQKYAIILARPHRKYARPSTTTISPSRSANAPFSIWYRAHFRIDLGDADAVSY
jgi:hypothetical protein